MTEAQGYTLLFSDGTLATVKRSEPYTNQETKIEMRTLWMWISEEHESFHKINDKDRDTMTGLIKKDYNAEYFVCINPDPRVQMWKALCDFNNNLSKSKTDIMEANYISTITELKQEISQLKIEKINLMMERQNLVDNSLAEVKKYAKVFKELGYEELSDVGV